MNIAGVEFTYYENMEDMVCEDADHMLETFRFLMEQFEKMKAPDDTDEQGIIDIILPVVTGETARKICASLLKNEKMSWDEKYKHLAKMKHKERNEVLAIFFKDFLKQVVKAQEELVASIGSGQNVPSSEA